MSSSGGEASPGEGGPGQGGHVGAARPAAVRGEVDVRGVRGGDGELRGGHEPAGGPARLEPGARTGGGRGDGPRSRQTAGGVETDGDEQTLHIPAAKTQLGVAEPRRWSGVISVPSR